MRSAFVHRRPLLRALLALLLFAGLLSTAAATHAGLAAGHSVAAATDSAASDLDASEQDDAEHDTLDIPDALTMSRAVLADSRPLTSHAMPLQWHASSALRPPIA
jgi:hypothetical protein